jgi:CubicO group peptidase (beta-lactamase class C family)
LVSRPLGLADTAFAVTDRSRLTVPYADATPEPMRMAELQTVPFGDGAGIRFAPDRVFNPASFPSGGAGIVATADDYLRFLECLRQGGGPILRPETTAAMISPQTSDIPVALPGPGWAWGLGVPVVTDAAKAKMTLSAGSYAWGGVYGHSWFVDPGRRISVVILTNTAIEGMNGRFPKALQEAITAAIPESGRGSAPSPRQGK